MAIWRVVGDFLSPWKKYGPDTAQINSGSSAAHITGAIMGVYPHCLLNNGSS
jgi:hypothetical protein